MSINMQTEKQCKICGQLKGLNEYYSYEKETKSKGKFLYYYPYCIECTRKKAVKNRNENRDRFIQQNKEWKENNRDRYLEYLSEYHKENREEEYIYMSEWQKNNKDKLKEYQIYRNMNKSHEISNAEWEDCKKYFNHRCAYCDIPIEEHYIKYKGELKLGDFHKEHVDHNGLNDLSNCIPACRSCNTSKHDRNLEDWYNEKNPIFKQERLEKIHTWLMFDHKLYIKQLNK